MAMPPKDFSGQVFTVTMMELRYSPGDIIERVACGATVYITKNGRAVAVLSPASTADGKIGPDGTVTGGVPITAGKDLGGSY